MSPFTGSFYLYDHTLRRAYPDEEIPVARDFGEPEITPGEKFRFQAAPFPVPACRPGSAPSRGGC